MNDPKFYRMKAAEMRDRAETASDPYAQRAFQDLVAFYQRLERRADVGEVYTPPQSN